MAWSKAGTTTLGSAGDILSISGLTAQKFNVFLSHQISSGNTNKKRTCNNSTGSLYAVRYSADGGADGTSVSQSALNSNLYSAADEFVIDYVCSISGEEKLAIMYNCSQRAVGAGTAPSRYEWAWKYVPSPDADITQFDYDNDDSGSYDTNSNLTALGSDGVESISIQDGAVYYDTDTNKSYVLYSGSWSEL